MPLKKRILLMIISICLTAIIGIYVLITITLEKTFTSIADDNTRNLLEMAVLTIENQYKSLAYHKAYATELRKEERINVIDIAISIIDKYNNDYLQGKISKARAQKLALDYINRFRYDNGNGYIWINNTDKPVPRMIIHPFFPEYNNKLSSAPLFYTSKDSSNIPLLATQLCEAEGAGFIDYFWSKPYVSTDTIIQHKLSYVKLYEPWQWVLGTGVYIEDIEKDASNRMDAILSELISTVGEIKIAESGYFFIMDSKKDIILHPILLYNENPDSTIYYNSFDLMNEIIKASAAQEKVYEYEWLAPNNDQGNRYYKKKVFIEYFKPLDWYVCASVYKREIDKPLILLGKKILIFSLIFSLFSILAALLLSEQLARPLNRLLEYVSGTPISNEKINFSEVPISGTKETKLLGLAIKEMLYSIEKQKVNILLAKKKTEESEEKYKFLVENTSSVFYINDKDGKIIYVSPNSECIFGFTSDEYLSLGQNIWSKRVHTQDYNMVIDCVKKLFEKGKPYEISYRIKTKDGKWLWVHDSGRVNKEVFGEDISYGVLTDITDKKLGEHKILQTMMWSEEQERSRIAKDLHDGVSPLLSAIKLFSQSMRDSTDKELQNELSEKIDFTITEAIQSINEISANISPHILQNFGLSVAIESFVNNILKVKGITGEVVSELNERAPIEIETTLYRISVELLNNTIKYANARHVFIRYWGKKQSIQMKYTDDGIGFDTEKVYSANQGMGLFNMKNRVEAINGKIKIRSEINRGIAVNISIPLA